MLEPFASAFSGQPLASTAPPPSHASEDADLRQQVQDLQAQLARLKRKPGRKSAGPRLAKAR